MNVKQITRALHTLSLLSDEDYDLVLKLRALTEDEREQFRTALELQKPVAKKATTATTRTYVRCSQCNKTKGHAFHKDSSNDGYHVFQLPSSSKSSSSSTKSSHASGMAAQLNKSLSQQRAVTTKDDNYDPEAERCTFPRDDGRLCFLLPDHNVHHMKSAVGFHPFRSSSDASSADNQSLVNDGAVDKSTSASGD